MGPIHRGAATGRRTQHIVDPEVGPIAGLARDAPRLQRRGRTLQRQIPWARNARMTYVANAVGAGITPIFRYQDGNTSSKSASPFAAAPIDPTAPPAARYGFPPPQKGAAPADPAAPPKPAAPKKTWARDTRDLWDECVPYWDAAGLLDYYGLQALAWSEVFDVGEIFVRRRFRRASDDLPVPLQVQLLEAEHVPHWYTLALGNGKWIRSGKQFNAIGQLEGFWMYPEHPGEWGYAQDSAILKFIPAEQIQHVFVPERAESIRGMPHLARSILRLFGLDEYDDAELDRQRMAAMITGFLELLDPEKATNTVGVVSRHSDAIRARGGAPVVDVEPNTLTVLAPGESYKESRPAELGANYKPFHDHNLRAVAADCGLTYEMLTGDLSNTSYVSLRFGSMEFRRRCRLLQGIFNFQYNRPLLGWWMDQAIVSGALEANNYEDSKQRRKYQRVLWVAPAWDRIQPDKEVPADIDAIRATLTTQDRVIAERLGEEGSIIREETAAIMADLDEKEIISTSDARVPADGGKTPTTQAKEDAAAQAKADALGKVTQDSGDANSNGSNVVPDPQKTGTGD